MKPSENIIPKLMLINPDPLLSVLNSTGLSSALMNAKENINSKSSFRIIDLLLRFRQE